MKHFGLPLTYAYATQSVAGNSPFRGIVCCIRYGTSKLIFVTMVNIVTPYLSLYGHPNNLVNNVLIPFKHTSYLTIASYVFLGGGAYGSLPDAAIWWCLRTGGGGILTSFYESYLGFWYKILV